jgi:hypothetical protein
VSKSTAPIYQLKVTLRDSKPPIWRRLLVAGDITLYRLHTIIQVAMGWWDSHLHQFIVGEREFYGEPSLDDYYEIKNERRFRLNQIAPGEKSKFIYEYDFGDDWRHTVVVEKVLPPDPAQRLPVCIKGKGACPPEDVGGMGGFYFFLEAIQNPDHPEHDQYREWIGEEAFDPQAFDLEAVNEILKTMR